MRGDPTVKVNLTYPHHTLWNLNMHRLLLLMLKAASVYINLSS